jgi:hypothetical protein
MVTAWAPFHAAQRSPCDEVKLDFLKALGCSDACLQQQQLEAQRLRECATAGVRHCFTTAGPSCDPSTLEAAAVSGVAGTRSTASGAAAALAALMLAL